MHPVAYDEFHQNPSIDTYALYKVWGGQPKAPDPDPNEALGPGRQFAFDEADEDEDPPSVVQLPERLDLSLIHISEPTRQAEISYAVF